MEQVAICPAIPMASVGDREAFLSLLREVCKETEATEPDAKAYFWLRGSFTAEGAVEPQLLVGGLELYAHEDALALVHRNGTSYKTMRETVSATQIVKYPKGGVVLRTPTGNGFLSKSRSLEHLSETEYIETDEFHMPSTEAQNIITTELEKLAKLAQASEQVLSFATFKPMSPAKPDALTLFVRYASREDAVGDSLKMNGLRKKFGQAKGSIKTISWHPTGFGFIRAAT